MLLSFPSREKIIFCDLGEHKLRFAFYKTKCFCRTDFEREHLGSLVLFERRCQKGLGYSRFAAPAEPFHRLGQMDARIEGRIRIAGPFIRIIFIFIVHDN